MCTLNGHPESQRKAIQAFPTCGQHKDCKPHPLWLEFLLGVEPSISPWIDNGRKQCSLWGEWSLNSDFTKILAPGEHSAAYHCNTCLLWLWLHPLFSAWYPPIGSCLLTYLISTYTYQPQSTVLCKPPAFGVALSEVPIPAACELATPSCIWGQWWNNSSFKGTSLISTTWTFE